MAEPANFISEDVLLALVEGEPLTPAQAAAARAALGADAELARLVRGMRADRAALADSAARIKAPAGLLAGVEATLEREALLGLPAEPAVLATLPISRVQPAGARAAGGGLRTILESNWSRGLAAAAAVAMLVGGTVLLAVRNTGRSRPVAPILANNTAEAPASSSGPLAMASEPAGARAAPQASEVVEAVSTEPSLAAAERAESAWAAGAVSDLDRAVALAREGRLAIRVVAPDVALARQSVEALARVHSVASAKPLSAQGAADLVGGLAQQHERRVAALRPGPDDGPHLAADRAADGSALIGPPPPSLAWSPPEAPAPVFDHMAFRVDVAPDAAALRAMLRSLEARGHRAGFVALDAAMVADEPPAPEDLFWWTQAPASWGERVRVGVVIQVR